MIPVCTNTQAQLKLLTEYHCIVIEKLEAVTLSFVFCVVSAHVCILLCVFSVNAALCTTAEEYNGGEERAAQESETPFSGRPALLLSDH